MSDPRPMRVVALLCLLAAPAAGRAAETTDPAPMSKTLLVLKLGSEQAVNVRTKFLEQPPTILLEFPEQRVIGALPEESAITKGIIRGISARYERRQDSTGARAIQALHIALAAPYAYQVRSEPGRIIIEILHPASVQSASMEVGLKGGAALLGRGSAPVSERFRAMQQALADRTPIPWTLELTDESPTAPVSLTANTVPAPAAVRRPLSTTEAPARPPAALFFIIWLPVAVALAMAGGAGLWVVLQRGVRVATGRTPSGVVLIDQLVWRAFERQGYELVAERFLTQSPGGTFRLIMKDGMKSALLFAGNGPFFEKQTVKHFLRAMADSKAERGILVASGSFTVPAQRLAKESQVTLIEREQLIELLSAGARSEYFTKQLEQQHARLEESKETLRQYAEELDTFRRQRNEASWQLGEERARSAKLEIEIEVLQQGLRGHEAELKRWEQDASVLRKQWEESQWYLGESHSRVTYLEQQVTALQEVAGRIEEAERAREKADWYLGEERSARESVETQLAELQRSFGATHALQETLQASVAKLKLELAELQRHGERRASRRTGVSEAFIELWNGAEQPIFSGCPRDVSSGGIGLETETELPSDASIRIRLCRPDHEPVESKGALVWQNSAPGGGRYHSGCRLVRPSSEARAILDDWLSKSLA